MSIHHLISVLATALLFQICSDSSPFCSIHSHFQALPPLINPFPVPPSSNLSFFCFYSIKSKFSRNFGIHQGSFLDNKLVAVSSSLLSIDKQGSGGTKLSTITPFTKLETSIYKALVHSFNKAAALRKMKRVASVAPFGACFSSRTIADSQTGSVVPYIDIALAGNDHNWRFYGANSMVPVTRDVMCLAFVDAGGKKPKPPTSMVIGAYQMENYVIEFDLVHSKLGISTSLLFHNTSCSQSPPTRY